MQTYFIILLLTVTYCISIVVVPGTPDSRILTSGTARTAPELYGKYCASCHGRDGRAKTNKGKFNHARDVADATWQDDVSDERIFNSILNGRNVRGNMPGFKDKLNEKEVDSLVSYVRGLRR
jgi:mono/diheme cytochrome c family protein